MEFLNGGDLEFHLKEQIMFSERIVRYYSAEIICGLTFLHSKGIIHRLLFAYIYYLKLNLLID